MSGPPDPARVLASYLDDLPPPPARESVRSTVDKHADLLERCLAGGPGRDGRVVVRFTIAPDGKALGGDVLLDEGLDEKDAACMLTAILSLHFPRAERGMKTEATYPIVLRDGHVVKASPLPPTP